MSSANDVRQRARRIAKRVAQATLGRLPAGSARLSGALAIEGGKPVRDVRLRPWPDGKPAAMEWREVSPELRAIFLSGREGLPQERQEAFARAWAEACGARHGLMLPHGTDALRIALAAVLDHDGLEYGGEVIVPNLSFIASATAPLAARFGVALVDVDPSTLNLDPARVEEAIVPGRTRAILPVHQFGQPADMTALCQLARRHGLKVIEDAAQAHGAAWESGPAGSLGDAAAFSFQSAKNLGCGEGGMLTTNEDAVFERAWSMHNAGRSIHDRERWDHPFLGWNCRATEYQAALLLHRAKSFAGRQAVRARNFARLRELLAGARALRPVQVDPRVRRHGMYMFALRYEALACGGLPLERFLEATGAEGAPIYRGYTSTISAQGAFAALAARRPEYVRVLPTPVADRAARELAYIPANAFLGGEEDMADIAAAIAKVERRFGGP